MSLCRAVQRLMSRRGLCARDIVHGVRGHRAATYRILSGSTLHPLLSSVVDLAAVLDTDPTDLLREAGLWPPASEPTDDLDRALLCALAALEALPPPQKRSALAVVQALLVAAGSP